MAKVVFESCSDILSNLVCNDPFPFGFAFAEVEGSFQISDQSHTILRLSRSYGVFFVGVCPPLDVAAVSTRVISDEPIGWVTSTSTA